MEQGISKLSLDKGTNSRKVKEEGKISCVEERRKEENECVRKDLILMCGEVFMEKCV